VLASSISAFINLLLNFIIIIVFMIISGVEFHASSLLVIWYVVQLFIFGVGLAFILSSLFVKLRDMNYIWEIITQALFYGSAIIYPIATIIGQHEKLGQILLLNPIAEAIQGARHTLINEANPTIASYTGNGWLTLIPLGIIIVVFVFGAWYFKKQSPYFAENI
jgi:ABC-2 type transport system permease protein